MKHATLAPPGYFAADIRKIVCQRIPNHAEKIPAILYQNAEDMKTLKEMEIKWYLETNYGMQQL